MNKRLVATLLVVAAVVIAGVVVLVLPAGHRTSDHSSGGYVTPGIPNFSPNGTPSSLPPPTADATTRVVDILQQMHQKAFNHAAAAPKNSAGLTGGTFINWGADWDGSPTTAADNTDYQSNGQTDAVTGQTPRHDEFTDLLYLRNLTGYRYAHPADHTFDVDISRMAPVVKSDFKSYTYYKCSLYGELIDLNRFDPGQGWLDMANTYAANVYHNWYNSSLGTIVDKSHNTYRVDYAAECADAFLDAGPRTQNSAMTTAGMSTAEHLLHNAENSQTHLFPLQMNAGAQETVAQAQVKVGDEAQILQALLDVYQQTHVQSFLTAVTGAVNSMYTDGLYDTQSGGFFFSIDSDGSNLQNSYKESRQGWMLELLRQLDTIQPGVWTAKANDMSNVVINQLWQPGSSGYVYRVTPGFGPLATNNGPNQTTVVETWVTAEAMDIACQVLESN
jgi:hypothetical protein